MRGFMNKQNRAIWAVALAAFAIFAVPLAVRFAGPAIAASARAAASAVASISLPELRASQPASAELARADTQGRVFIPFRIAFGNTREDVFVAPSVGKMIRVNLETMRLTTYENGEKEDSFAIVKKGQGIQGAPGGEFRVLYKDERHYSSTYRAYLPYAIQFFGNFSIHGTPEDKNGKELASSSGGWVRLATKDAEKLFAWSDQKTLVSVYGNPDTKISRTAIDGSSYFLRDPNKRFSVSAQAYLVGDLETGEILFEKNKDMVSPIASVSKLFTALTYLDAVDQAGIVTVSKAAVSTEGSNGNLRVGEKIPAKELIYPLLLESSNDGAEAIAEYAGRDGFMAAMNERVKALGLANTSFADPSGLSPENISTPSDLFAFARYIYENRQNDILAVTKKDKYSFGLHTWFNSNPFFAQERYIGGKTGYTSQAQQTFLSLFSVDLSEFDSRKIAIILLKTPDRAADTNAILNYIRSNVYYGKDALPNASVASVSDLFYVPQKEEVTLAFVGDMMLDRGVEASVGKNGKGDYSYLFAKNKDATAIIRNADIAFGNLEGPASDKGSDLGNLYSFRMDPEVLPLLKNIGFDALSVANNHAGDWGRTAFEDTLARMRENELVAVGGAATKPEAESVKIVTRNGIRVGFLGFSDVGPAWLEAGETRSGILLASDPKFADIVRDAAEQTDVLVVSFHFGDEYKPHTARQSDLARLAIDSGAAVVIGHHPHVTQAVETYNGGIIAYSLGNFIFDQSWSKETMKGMILEVKMNKKGVMHVKQYDTEQNATFQIEKVAERKDPVAATR